MKNACVVVIGHVDHGKTSLVRALTGIETDRLAEEKQRGLSITNGYAHKSYASGTIDFIDVPGHEDFIAAMVAGATGARAALVVISATEGVCAQTREHLAIADLLGINTGIIAITKADLLPPDLADHAVEGIKQALANTGFANLPIVLCSAATGDGLDALHAKLENLLGQALDTSAPLHSFMPIDRVFSIAGHGTVVTGTLLGGALTVGDTATLYPTGQSVTLRGLHSRGEAREQITNGTRAAVNLRGVSVADVPRGAVLSVAGDVAATLCMDVALDLLSDQDKPPKHNEQMRVLFGTTQEVARIRLFAGSRYAQLRFSRPLVGYAGQHAVLRRLSPPQTIGGAAILDPQAKPARAKDKAYVSALQAAEHGETAGIARAVGAAPGGVFSLRDLARLARNAPDAARAALGAEFEDIGAGLICESEKVERCKRRIIEILESYHKQHPLKRAAPQSVLSMRNLSQALIRHACAQLEHSETIRSHGAEISLCGHDPFANLTAPQSARLEEIERCFEEAGLIPPAPAALEEDPSDSDLVALLAQTGRLMRLHNIALNQIVLLHPHTIGQARSTLSTAFPAPLRFTTSQARIALGTTRRVIVPLLEHFDTEKLTRRKGDLREMNIPKGVSPDEPN